MNQSNRETLRRRANLRRIDALFRAMSTDYLLREQFVTDPVQVLSEYLHGTRLPEEEASTGNQLVYAAMSNPELLSWFQEYAVERRGEPPAAQEFLGDFSRAVVDHGGREVVVALLRCSVPERGLVGFNEDLLHYFLNVAGATTGGTEGGESLTATEPSTATATNVGTGTMTDDQLATVWTHEGGTHDHTIQTLTDLTFKTYITYTTDSTHPSPTRHTLTMDWQEAGPDHVYQTLNALHQYAVQLRQAGALEGFE